MENQIKLSDAQLKEVIDRLDAIVEISKVKGPKNPRHIIFDNIGLSDLFKVSTRTLHHWRYNKLIAYSQVGSKIFYRMDDIQKFLDKYYNPVKI